MRISDWSSDVCSSDLRGCVGLSCPERGAGGSGRLVDLQAAPFGIVLPDLRPDPFDGIGWRVQQFLVPGHDVAGRSEEHTSELQSLMRISYAVFCLKKQKTPTPSTRSQRTYHNQH